MRELAVVFVAACPNMVLMVSRATSRVDPSRLHVHSCIKRLCCVRERHRDCDAHIVCKCIHMHVHTCTYVVALSSGKSAGNPITSQFRWQKRWVKFENNTLKYFMSKQVGRPCLMYWLMSVRSKWKVTALLSCLCLLTGTNLQPNHPWRHHQERGAAY